MSWQKTLEDEKAVGGPRFTFDWYRNHFITRELLDCGLLRGRVCDVACGIARRAMVMSDATGLPFTGVDCDDWAIEHAKRDVAFHFPRVSISRGDFYSLPFDDRSFDTVLLVAALEHAAFPTHVVRELCRVTADNGTVIITITENNYHADPDHKSSFSEEGLRKYLSSFGATKTWVSDHVIYAAVTGPFRLDDSVGKRPKVVLAEMRHPDTYSEYWDQELRKRCDLIPISCDLDAVFSDDAIAELFEHCSTADVLHLGTGALRIGREHLDEICQSNPTIHISKWWGDVEEHRYENECESISSYVDTMFISVSNFVGQCATNCTQIHMNSPAVLIDRGAIIPFCQRPWEIGLFANAYTASRHQRLIEFLPFESRKIMWFGDGAPMGRLSRMATNNIIGCSKINVNIVDPIHSDRRHWFSARVSNALAQGCIVLTARIDCIDSVLGDLVVQANDSAASWQNAIDEILDPNRIEVAIEKSRKSIEFANQYLGYADCVDTLVRSWGY